jgi:cytochrome oxidase assembly protein ShyY1
MLTLHSLRPDPAATLAQVRFLISKRWLLFALFVAALAWLTSLLGQWQFHRLDERRAQNHLVAANLAEPPVALDTLMTVGSSPSERDEWREVIVHGTWDDEHTIVLKYQTRDGGAGVDVVTPLRTEDGAGVLVDRGWLGTKNVGSGRPDLPPATTGPVTVLGWIRLDGTGGATTIGDMATRAISSKAAGKVLPYPLYGGFLDLHTESPAPAHRLGATELPDDTSEGPHFFYGLQWWFFGVLAVVGFAYLVYDEWRRAREEKSERAEQATVDGEHDPGDE